MMDDLVSVKRTFNVASEEEEMQEFCEHFVKHSQFTTSIAFNTGSRSEMDGLDMMFNRYDLNEELLDQDIMFYKRERYASSINHSIPEIFDGQVVRINSVGVHCGYTKLRGEEDEAELQLSKYDGLNLGDKHGPADTFKTDQFAQHIASLFPQISADMFIANNANMRTMSDYVVSVHSPHWPADANEWLTRARMNDIQLKSTVKEVARYGCDFVQVSHKLSANESEWRFSFSRAELIMIHNWTTSQRIAYLVLHVLNKIIKSKNDASFLCSYYFKTLMLWATEEKPTAFWLEDVLADSICELLFQLSYWLKIRYCPNYFMPTNNMIDHLPDMVLSADIDALYQLLRNLELITDVLHEGRRVELDIGSRTFYLEAPMWLYTSLLLTEQINHQEERFTKLFLKNFPVLVHKSIFLEFSDIYQGLKFHQNASRSVSQSIAENLYPLKALRYFKNGLVSCDKQDHILLHCSKSIDEIVLPNWFLAYEPDASDSQVVPNQETVKARLYTLNANHKQSDQKPLLYSQSLDCVNQAKSSLEYINDIFRSKTEVRIVTYIMATVDGKTYTGAQYYREFPSMSPTLNISWFLNKAYLANFYYTVQHYYTATKEMCEEIMDASKRSVFNEQFAERSLPVILSTNWTSVFDDELQVMLGLYSLCVFMFNETDRIRSVCLGVCPVLFALYLKNRCALDQMFMGALDMYGKQFLEHISKTCSCDRSICNGERLILLILKTTADRRVAEKKGFRR